MPATCTAKASCSAHAGTLNEVVRLQHGKRDSCLTHNRRRKRASAKLFAFNRSLAPCPAIAAVVCSAYTRIGAELRWVRMTWDSHDMGVPCHGWYPLECEAMQMLAGVYDGCICWRVHMTGALLLTCNRTAPTSCKAPACCCHTGSGRLAAC